MIDENKQAVVIEKVAALKAEYEEINVRKEKMTAELLSLMLEELRLEIEGKIFDVEMEKVAAASDTTFSILDCFISQAALDLLKQQSDYHTKLADYEQRRALYLFRKAAHLAERAKFNNDVAEFKVKTAKLVDDPEVREVMLDAVAEELFTAES